MEKSLFEQMGGTYRKVGDYYIPNLILSPEKEHRSIGIWGQRHRDYLKQYNQVTFNIMLMNGTLFWIIVNKVDRKKGIKKKNLAQPD